MEPQQQNDVMEAVVDYFRSIGCYTAKFRLDPSLCLPNSSTIWSFLLDGDNLTVRAVVPRPWDATDKQQKLFEVALSDPESFPKILAHMEKHSKFLRGGTNHTRFVPKAV